MISSYIANIANIGNRTTKSSASQKKTRPRSESMYSDLRTEIYREYRRGRILSQAEVYENYFTDSFTRIPDIKTITRRNSISPRNPYSKKNFRPSSKKTPPIDIQYLRSTPKSRRAYWNAIDAERDESISSIPTNSQNSIQFPISIIS